MMHRTFYWRKTVTLLFDQWKTKSWLGYALTLLAIFLLSVFYQYKEDRRLRFKIASATPKPSLPIDSEFFLSRRLYVAKNSAKIAMAVLFGINSAIGYMLMLSVMSFNGGVFIAVVLGLAVGYLFFRNVEEAAVVADNPCPCA